MRVVQQIKISNKKRLFKQLLQWSQQYNEVVWLESNHHKDKYSAYDAVLAVEAHIKIQMPYDGAFNALKTYQTKTKDWLFGYLSYDLKNDLEDLQSNNLDELEFPELYFFQPKKLFFIKNNILEVHYLVQYKDAIKEDIQSILQTQTSRKKNTNKDHVSVKLRMSKDSYFKKVNTILKHIQRGDIYEANFCQEFFIENMTINPLQIYRKLNRISKPPFATFLKRDHQYLLSASLERYLKKQGNNIISQPIKGTVKRSNNKDKDKHLIDTLKNDPKERSENIMIVDLVRNDLSKTALKGSVKAKELCKIYTFKQVHQMISTIVSKVAKHTNPIDVIKSTFPMGSMTGAPKISAMQIIEKQEHTKRGLYSGAVGYITPQGNFDFNVVIRSILYNKNKAYTSFSVGSAITAKSNPKNEYEECLIKAKAMRRVLES